MATETTSRSALLIVNVQICFTLDPPQGIPAAGIVRENVALVLEHARKAHPAPTIIHIRNIGDPGEPDEPGTQVWDLKYPPLPGEHVIDKRKSNAFVGTSLGDLIAPDAEVVVVGLHSEYSVKSTCKAALQRGNMVLLIKGAHGTYNHMDLADGVLTPADKISAQVEEELDRAGAIILDMKYLPGIFDGR
ncbi:Isochorismatase-like protein [Mycena sp. CBHHK59/15]|nr:Isochorismatase-like protein [Mycena sp. CBHHK59/15]